MISGAVRIGQEQLGARDSFGLVSEGDLELEVIEHSDILLIEVPLK